MKAVRRREFLKSLPKIAAGVAFAPAAAFALTQASGKKFVVTSTFDTPQNPSTCGVIDVGEKTVRYFSLDHQKAAHGYAQHPAHRDRVVILDKFGERATLVSLSERKVLHAISPSPGAHFYGHGVFSPGGKLFYSVEAKKEGNHEGFLAIRDGESLALLGRFPTFGRSPHDIALLENEKQLVVGTGNDFHVAPSPGSSLAFLDFETHKLVKEVALPAGVLASHLSLGPRNRIFLSTLGHATRLKESSEWEFQPANALYLDGETLKPLETSGGDFQRQRYGFSSVVSEDQKTFCVTYGRADGVGIYSVAERKLIRFIGFEKSPSALAPLGEGGFLVGTSEGTAWHLPAPQFTPTPFFPGKIWGSHALAVSV